MRILKEHVNKRSCPLFCATKGTITPITARVELRMHLRHQSFQGLILDQNLMTELAQHCAFCHQQVGPRAIARHYSEQYHDLLQFAQQFKDRVRWAANLGSGKGICPLCRISSQKLHTHTCGVLYQLTILAGHTLHTPNFPVMLVLKRSWIAAFDAETTGVHHPALETRPKPPKPHNAESEIGSKPDDKTSSTCLHRCDHCHVNFLSALGLAQHLIQAHADLTTPALTDLPQVTTSSSSNAHRGRPFKPPVTGSLAQVLRMPGTGPIPEPMTVFKCPLCQVMIGRKAVAAHLRTVHQFERPEKLDLVPSRDVLPGRLTCAHCQATFSVEFALRTHFTKASCPVRLCQMTSDLHFGPVTAPATTPTSDSDPMPLDPLPGPAGTMFVRYGLIRHRSNGPDVEPL